MAVVAREENGHELIPSCLRVLRRARVGETREGLDERAGQNERPDLGTAGCSLVNVTQRPLPEARPQMFELFERSRLHTAQLHSCDPTWPITGPTSRNPLTARGRP